MKFSNLYANKGKIANESLELSEWISNCNSLVNDFHSSKNLPFYIEGISIIYGCCLCYIFDGSWTSDSEKIQFLQIELVEDGETKPILNPYDRIRTLDHNPYSDRFFKLATIDCFHTHEMNDISSCSGHPLLKYGFVEDSQSKLEAEIEHHNLDKFDLLKISQELGELSFSSEFIESRTGEDLVKLLA